MKIEVSFDPVRFLGNVFITFIAICFGNVVAALIVAAITPSLDGGSLYAFAGLVMLAFSMVFVKIAAACVITIVSAMATSTPRATTLWAASAGAAAGFLFTLVVGVS